MALISFCGLLTLQVGAAILAAVFFTLAGVILAANIFDYHNDIIDGYFPFSLILMVIFVVGLIVAGALMFASSYTESRSLAIMAVVVIAILLCYWIILCCFSFLSNPDHVRGVCIQTRCPESFWIANLGYRRMHRPDLFTDAGQPRSADKPADGGKPQEENKAPSRRRRQSGTISKAHNATNSTFNRGVAGPISKAHSATSSTFDRGFAGPISKAHNATNSTFDRGVAGPISKAHNATNSTFDRDVAGPISKAHSATSSTFDRGVAGPISKAHNATNSTFDRGVDVFGIQLNEGFKEVTILDNTKNNNSTENENPDERRQKTAVGGKELAEEFEKSNISDRGDSERNRKVGNETSGNSSVVSTSYANKEFRPLANGTAGSPPPPNNEPSRYYFGSAMIGAIILFIINLLFLIFSALVMYSWAQELDWADYYIEDAPVVYVEDY